jgi:hypothetical protein
MLLSNTEIMIMTVEEHFEMLEQIHDDRFAKQYGFLRPYKGGRA